MGDAGANARTLGDWSMSYNRKQEARRAELVAELKALDSFRNAALSRLRTVLDQALGVPMPGSDRTDAIIKYADQLRDALAPFDSGEREAKPPVLGNPAPPQRALHDRKPPIPANVGWWVDRQIFMCDGNALSRDFLDTWYPRRAEFPKYPG